MKRFLMLAGLLLASTGLFAQPGPPKSPATTETATIAGKAIAIHYSAPAVRGREGHIFTKDGLISHDPGYPLWRAGANAATTLHTEGEVELGGVTLAKGDYSLYVDLSDPEHWVLVVNKQTGQWGLSHDAAQDVVRLPMKMEKPEKLVESLKFSLKDEGNGKGSLALVWEHYCGAVEFRVK